jgi:hypothetical protein
MLSATSNQKEYELDSNANPTTTKYQQVVVDVPEDRVAEFHALFGRFLASPAGRLRRGRRAGHHRVHRRGCAQRHQATERGAAVEPAAEATEI